MKTATETPTLTEITPFHFTLTQNGVRLDIAYKQHLGKWRISRNGETLTLCRERYGAKNQAIAYFTNPNNPS